MSVVCTKVFQDTILIASDSQITHGWTALKDNKTVKLFQSKLGMIIGGVGDAAPLALMKIFTNTHVPDNPTVDGITEFLFEFHSWLDDNSEDVDDKNEYHILFDGHAFLASGYYVHEIEEFGAIGSGADYALAALHLGHSPFESVAVACELNVFCSTPIVSHVMFRRS